MKAKKQNLFLVTLLILTLGACQKKYQVSVTLTEKKNAPSMQSFVHGVSGSDWLLFAGRTNSKDSLNGGLHNLDGDYTITSFTPPSYNDSIHVYNVEKDESISISIEEMIHTVHTNFPSYSLDTLNKYKSVFKNTNAFVRQDADFLYVIGGYGPKYSILKHASPKDTTYIEKYITYNQIAKIHVPSLINLVKGDLSKVNEDILFAFGQNTSLIATGGELHKFNGSFYFATGHDFGNNAPNFQKYVDAVYPVTFGPLVVHKDTIMHGISASVGAAISDVSNPTDPSADNLSVFRRRDGPIAPAIYISPVNGKIEPGLAIYAGVFKPGDDSNLQAWNSAIYVHPSWANSDSKIFTFDAAYDQKNYNVYASPNFVVYDADTKISHTYLLGGIGDGKHAPGNHLSGFTNTGLHIKTKINSVPLKSTNELFSTNLFGGGEANTAPFYGAEAILFPNSDLMYFKTSTGEVTEVIDMSSYGAKKSIEVGYIFGGIEAFVSNPGTYGKTKSRASNKIWKVTLKKE